MFQEEFNHIITQLSNLQEADVADVRTIADRYPYCQTAQVIYARKLRDLESPQFDAQLRKAALFAYDRNVLHQVIEHYQYADPVAAGYEDASLPETEEITLLPEMQSEPVPDVTEQMEVHQEIIESIPELQPDIRLPVEEPAEEFIETPDPQMEVQEEMPVDLAEEEIAPSVTDIETEEILEAALKDIPELQSDLELPTESLEELTETLDPQAEIMEEMPLDVLEDQAAEALLTEESNEILETAISEIPELQSDSILQETSALPEMENVSEDPQELVNEEMVFDEMESAMEEMEIMEEEDIDEGADALVEELLQMQPEEEQNMLEQQVVLNIENDLVAAVDSEKEAGEDIIEQENDMQDNSEDIFFDLPAYDIERELGSLREEDLIKITIQRPVQEPEPEELEASQADSFVGWLNRLGGTSKPVLVEMKAANKPIQVYKRNDQSQPKEVSEKKVVNELIAAELAKKSLTLDERIATETLARILVMQGKYPKAIEMYERLSLLKPKKSDYFAALIDQLKKRIK